jgi:hypothetical protein
MENENRTIIRLNETAGEYEFKNATISESDGMYGKYFMIFHGESDKKITFVNESTVLGSEIEKIYSKIVPTVFEMTVRSFDSASYKGWNVVKVTKLRNNDFETTNNKGPTLEGF